MKDDINVNNVHTTKALCHSKFSLKYKCSLCGTTPYSCCTEPSFAHHLVVGIHSKHACVPFCSVTSSAWYVWMGRNARPSSLAIANKPQSSGPDCYCMFICSNTTCFSCVCSTSAIVFLRVDDSPIRQQKFQH